VTLRAIPGDARLALQPADSTEEGVKSNGHGDTDNGHGDTGDGHDDTGDDTGDGNGKASSAAVRSPVASVAWSKVG
jgi:hypothetical protein